MKQDIFSNYRYLKENNFIHIKCTKKSRIKKEYASKNKKKLMPKYSIYLTTDWLRCDIKQICY